MVSFHVVRLCGSSGLRTSGLTLVLASCLRFRLGLVLRAFRRLGGLPSTGNWGNAGSGLSLGAVEGVLSIQGLVF